MHDLRTGICPLCDHRVVIQAWPADWVQSNAARNVGAAYSQGKWGKVSTHGPMTTYICQACGLTQWFTVNAHEIPIGEEFCTKLVEGPPRGQ